MKIGDTLPLATAEGTQVYRVVGIGTDVLNAKLDTGYISRASLERDFHRANDVLLLVRKAPTADALQVRIALEKITKNYPAFTLFAFTRWRSLLLDTLSGAMGFFISAASCVDTAVVDRVDQHAGHQRNRAHPLF